MKSPILSILTVNFGSANKIKSLWKSLQEFPPSIEWEWIIVDNPTKKGGDGKLLSNFFKNEDRVHVIQLASNLGYGGGNAEGFRFCRGEFLAILNPDTQVQKGTLDILLSVLKSEKKSGIVVPVLKTNKGEILENCRKFPTFWGLMKRRLFGSQILSFAPEGNAKETDWAQGSFWLLRSELFEKLEGFDPRFFLFLEDTDFCRRVRKAGFRVLQIPSAIAEHSPNRLSGGNIFGAISRKTFWIHLESAVKYFVKWRYGRDK
jgi:GT2 family glycosyltransferase